MNRQSPTSPLILTIDDDNMMRAMLQEILGRDGFEVISTASGHQGIEWVKTKHPQLVLLDVMMPGIDGFACLRTIRALPGLELLPVVMLTGADDLESINRCFELGATDFISKPITWPTLPHRLRYLLRASGAMARLARSEAELRTAQKIAQLGMWDWQVAEDRLHWSDEVLDLLSVDRAAIQGRIDDFYRPLPAADAETLRLMLDNCVANRHNLHLQLHIRLADGSDRVLLIRGEPLFDGDKVYRVHGTLQDITERHRIEEQIRFLSHYDPLTGLPNRTLFKDILGKALSHCKRYHCMLSGLFVGIARFRRINETLGPRIGDRLLKQFAERLTAAVRDCDYIAVNADYALNDMSVSRLGGNEFTVLLNQIHDSSDSVKVIQRIDQQMARAFLIDEHEIFIGINIGIAIYPGDGDDVESFIQNGEFAMIHARRLGPSGYQFFCKSLNVAAVHKLSMETSLRRAIERGELLLHYQPIIQMGQQRVVGCEALIRWQHPEQGLIAPAQFIPIAEDAGLIADISNWVLETACAQLSHWRRIGLPTLTMAVNISAHQFYQADFVPRIEHLLKQHQLDPQQLKLELTESLLLDRLEDALLSLRRLRDLKVKISIDDFGTGYSSLGYLKRLPISELKIDRSFVSDIPHNEEDMAITSAILALAKALALDVVAEGVEQSEQADFLIQQNCEIAQGFLYSKPLTPTDLEAFIRDFS